MTTETRTRFDQEYNKRSPLFGSVPTKVVIELCEFLPENADLVELGSGDGRDTIFLLGEGHRVCAIDFSVVGISKLESRAAESNLSGKLDTMTIDVCDWNPSTDSVDGVVGITILDHVDQEEASRIINRIKSAVRVSGLVCLEMHTDRDPACVGGPLNEDSEFSKLIKFFATPNWLVEKFIDSWRIVYYSDRFEQDLDHGNPHFHGFTTLLAQRLM